LLKTRILSYNLPYYAIDSGYRLSLYGRCPAAD
jgi:hypothetical protein